MPLIECSSRVLNDDAYPLSFTTNEGLSRISEFLLEFEDADADVDLDALLGNAIDVRVELAHGGHRQFHAYITGGSDRGQRHERFVYRLELSTWLWFLRQNQNCRIFQGKSVPEIVEQVFGAYDLARFRFDLEGSYPAREYCVQFRETDFDFVSRLLEDEGLHYRFEHASGEHMLVVSDRQAFAPLPAPYDAMLYLPDSEEHRAIREGIQSIGRSRRMQPSQVVLRDYDYLSPAKQLQSSAEDDSGGAPKVKLEWFDYAAGYADTERGGHLARLRLEAWQAQTRAFHGESNAMGLVPGSSFTLTLHPDAKRNRAFKLLDVQYRFIQDGPDSATDGRNVSCAFAALEHDVVYRPPRCTPSPRMPGIQSATVVGPPKSEVHTDKHSRVRVHFHWDRYRTTEEDASCWIRVSQAWAGKGWGVLALPRVGQEVLVTYVDGDLDRPLVTGVVYNGDNPPPYDLPAQSNYSGIVSRSLDQGMPQNASHMTFDDARGTERFMVHAERDMLVTVERNEDRLVGQNRSSEVAMTDARQATNEISQSMTCYNTIGTCVEQIQEEVSMTESKMDTTSSSVSLTSVSTGVTGISTGFTGVSTGITGVSTGFVGIDVGFAGISTGITGISNGITGVSNSMTGVSQSVTGSSVSLTASSISTTGSSISSTGFSASYTGVSMSQTGHTIDTSGAKASSAGTETKTRGMQSKN